MRCTRVVICVVLGERPVAKWQLELLESGRFQLGESYHTNLEELIIKATIVLKSFQTDVRYHIHDGVVLSRSCMFISAKKCSRIFVIVYCHNGLNNKTV